MIYLPQGRVLIQETSQKLQKKESYSWRIRGRQKTTQISKNNLSRERIGGWEHAGGRHEGSGLGEHIQLVSRADQLS